MWVITYRYSGAAWPEERAGGGRGWRPRIMGVGNRFVSAAVIIQINTAGNLFKYRNKRSPPGAGAARAAVIYDSSLGNVSAFAPSMDAEPFCRFYITYLLLARKRLNTHHI